MKKKALYLMTMLAGIIFMSCEQSPSLQKYFVEKMDDSSFLIVNLPINIDSLFQKDISTEDRLVAASIKKLNLLFYRINKSKKIEYKEEVNRLKSILASKRYQHLMDFKAFDKASGNLLFEGEENQIEEGIVFVNAEEFGFGVLRILGDEINPSALMKLSKKVDPKQLEKQLKASVGALGDIYKSSSPQE